MTEANEGNGCMRMVRGSQKEGIALHRDTWEPNNILTRSQTIDAEIDGNQAAWTTV